MKITINHYHAVGQPTGEAGEDVDGQEEEEEDDDDDVCGICRVAFDGCCPDCKVPGDACPPSAYPLFLLPPREAH
jgi:anaphase-promoting complex subunit 11